MGKYSFFPGKNNAIFSFFCFFARQILVGLVADVGHSCSFVSRFFLRMDAASRRRLPSFF